MALFRRLVWISFGVSLASFLLSFAHFPAFVGGEGSKHPGSLRYFDPLPFDSRDWELDSTGVQLDFLSGAFEANFGPSLRFLDP